MRLICPNCAAQYEVDDGVIPTDGRDVQCSNCGHAWFQPGAYADAAETSDWTDAPIADEPGDVPEEETADILESAGLSPDPASPSEAVLLPEDDDAADVPTDDGTDWGDDELQEADTRSDPDDAETGPPGELSPEQEPVAAPLPARQELDDSVLTILKEEAGRETEARRAEGSSLEMQPDLGLAAAIGAMVKEAAAVDDTASDRAASQRDGPAEEADDATQNRGPRRELLPDIEEINSTLSAKRGRSASNDTDSNEAEQVERRRSGFRRGFSLALLLTVLLLALYVLAPAISAKVPALAGVLDRYVAAVNDGRLWLDELMKTSTEALRQDGAQGG